MGNMENSGLAHREQELIDQFLADNVLFLGPDPEIMHEHDISPRTEIEESAMQTVSDPDMLPDFFRDNYRVEPQPDNHVSATYRNDAFTAGIGTRFRLNDFYATVARLP